jgi:hypothetical protein
MVAPMPRTAEILGVIGELPVPLPQAMSRALSASARIRYCTSLFELAERHARDPAAELPSLRSEREACGLEDGSLDEVAAASTPLRYGQRLDEILGRRSAIEFLEFVLRATSEGLTHRRSERFIRDEIRADLLGRFETLEHGVLAVAVEHSRVIGELARAVLERLGNIPGDDRDLRGRAADWEAAADQMVDRVRGLARNSPRAQLYGRLLAEADDVADALEEAAFLLCLPPASADAGPARTPLLALAALLVAGGRHWATCLDCASRLKRGSREHLQSVLDAEGLERSFQRRTSTNA